MLTRGQKNCERESRTGRSKDKGLRPRVSRRGRCVKLSAKAGQERRGNFGVSGDAEAGVDGGKKRLLFGEGGAALSAGFEMRAQGSHLYARGRNIDRIIFQI